jgi:hypothetical protein
MMHRDTNSGCLLPGLQAFFTALLLGAIVTFAAALVGAQWQTAILAGCLAGCIGALVHWFMSQRLWVTVAYGTFYQVSQAEPVQEPETLEPQSTVRIELHSEDGRHIEFADLPCNRLQLAKFAGAALDGRSLAIASWTGYGAPFTRSQYEQLRNALIQRGLLFAGRGASGLMVTRAGKAAFEYLALNGTVQDEQYPNQG